MTVKFIKIHNTIYNLNLLESLRYNENNHILSIRMANRNLFRVTLKHFSWAALNLFLKYGNQDQYEWQYVFELDEYIEDTGN